MSFRVPVPDVSVVDLTVRLGKSATYEDICKVCLLRNCMFFFLIAVEKVIRAQCEGPLKVFRKILLWCFVF